MKSKLFWLIVIFQVFTILYLVRNLQIKRQDSKISVSPVNRSDVVQNSPSDDLEYFYEPQPGKAIVDSTSWLTGKVTYKINSDSLNDEQEYSVEKQPGIYRIETIGDSFTYGAFVNTKQNYPEQLEKKLGNSCSKQKFEVINLGVGGYDIQYTVRRFISRGKKYDPDIVIWLLNSWDYERINEIVIKKSNDITENASKSGNLKKMMELEGHYFATTMAMDDMFNSMGKERLLEKQLSYFNELRDNYHGKLLVLYFPDQINNETIKKGYNEFLTKIKSDDGKTTVIKTLPYNTFETLKIDPHPSVNDYKKLSNWIFDKLIKEDKIICD